ncbi:MAG: class I SAM-dependent methyltransferase [Bacteroidetes bacterium]|nr:class I SAM-dependent methyltransferase [Bacteroidota bacterium]MBS1649290.1 class I SAM-dependent methyltransferase [Bacteroidota bacterium]
MNFDYSICKLCGNGGNTIKYRLRMANVIVCKHCGFHYTDYIDEEYKAAASNAAIVLSEKEIDFIEQKMQSNAARFNNHINKVVSYVGPNKILLDVGFGGALFLNEMVKKNYNCYGIELDQRWMSYVKNKYQLPNLYNLPVQDNFWQKEHTNFFGAIVLWDVIEHVNYPIQIVQQCTNLLKSGGYIFIDTPCRNAFYHKFGELISTVSFGKMNTLLHAMYSNHPYGHKQILSKKDMHLIMHKAGLKIVEIKLFHELSFPISFYLNRILFSNFLAKTLSVPISWVLKVFRIKNKMLVVAVKK